MGAALPNLFHETVQAAFVEEMARWTQEGRRPALFWRDDDLTRPLPSVRRFIETSNRTRVPIVFAAIPSALTAEAVALVADSDLCGIAVHGFAHHSHAAPGQPSSEYPAGRGIDEVRAELREGRQRIRALAGELAIDMFVPPWGRFDPIYRDLLVEEGYTWISGEKKLGDPSRYRDDKPDGRVGRPARPDYA